MKQTKENTRRYYLHRKLKGLYRINARGRTVFVPATDTDNPLNNKALLALSQLRYSIQTFIS